MPRKKPESQSLRPEAPASPAAPFTSFLETWTKAVEAVAHQPFPGALFGMSDDDNPPLTPMEYWRRQSRTAMRGIFEDKFHPPKGEPPPPDDEDDYSAKAFAEVTDRAVHAQIARLTGGVSPLALSEAWSDWAMHLGTSPGKRTQIGIKAIRKAVRLLQYMALSAIDPNTDACIEPLPQDRRFRAPAWQQWPFNIIYQSFLLQQQLLHVATTGVHGVSKKSEEITAFSARQMLDLISPSNFASTNPEVLQRTGETLGRNLVNGWMNFLEDWQRLTGGHPPVGAENFPVGERVAATKGKVVYRNRLIELIQYSPTTKQTHPEPVLITPAWIMKYYILDLQPENSLIRHLVDQGFTVFTISWKNPGPEDRDLGLDDYLNLGFYAALDAVNAIVPDQKVHATGYCLGGTLLTIAAAALRRDGDERLASLTLFAAQADFEEAGELTLFITESQLHMLEDMMWEQGFLDAKQMAGAFQILRSNDLIFSRNMKTYLLGEREEMNDMMAWNSDATRMPYRMHSDYLRKLFLNNDLAEGRLEVDGRPVFVSDIDLPIFAVGTETDHVAPWKSAFKIHRLSGADVTFVLASGGHNGGIVSEPGRPHRHYRIHDYHREEAHLDPEAWLDRAALNDGSWWSAWFDWLTKRSGALGKPPSMGTEHGDTQVLGDAPGQYVLQR